MKEIPTIDEIGTEATERTTNLFQQLMYIARQEERRKKALQPKKIDVSRSKPIDLRNVNPLINKSGQ
ncbi:MAG TPA: hypothetical protein VNT30_05220 [Stellaceae bacterium]|nr:hypothetical protein [Stellaceae bacterium]